MKRGCTAVPLFYRFYKNKTKGKKSLPESTGMNFSHDTDGKSGSVRKKEVPQCILLNGVFTLEAAVVLPLLAAFFVAILFFFRVMQVQLTVENALNRSGRLMAVYAAGENGGQVIEKTGTVVATAFLVKELKGEPVIEEYVRGGTFGIYLLRSTFKGQEIHLVAQCYMKLPVELLGKKTVKLSWNVVCRKWTGWEAEDETDESDPIVYVAETGTVYHRTEMCTYLNLSITSVETSVIEQQRNANGGKYYACERCIRSETLPECLYITEQGNRYHASLDCSGLKRTVQKIYLSEVGGRKPCSRCGGKEEP